LKEVTKTLGVDITGIDEDRNEVNGKQKKESLELYMKHCFGNSNFLSIEHRD